MKGFKCDIRPLVFSHLSVNVKPQNVLSPPVKQDAMKNGIYGASPAAVFWLCLACVKCFP